MNLQFTICIYNNSIIIGNALHFNRSFSLISFWHGSNFGSRKMIQDLLSLFQYLSSMMPLYNTWLSIYVNRIVWFILYFMHIHSHTFTLQQPMHSKHRLLGHRRSTDYFSWTATSGRLRFAFNRNDVLQNAIKLISRLLERNEAIICLASRYIQQGFFGHVHYITDVNRRMSIEFNFISFRSKSTTKFFDETTSWFLSQ